MSKQMAGEKNCKLDVENSGHAAAVVGEPRIPVSLPCDGQLAN